MYQVYILKSINFNITYTGITDDIERRLQAHNESHSGFSNVYKPWKLMHIEACNDRNEARAREKYLKSAAGRRWIKNTFFIS